MHPIQTRYLDAKTAYDAACTAHTAALEARSFFALLDADAAIDTLVAIELDAEIASGHDAAFQTCRAAKDALFVWGQKMALMASRAHKQPQETALVNTLFATIHQHPHLEDKLIAICLQLDLDTSPKETNP